MTEDSTKRSEKAGGRSFGLEKALAVLVMLTLVAIVAERRILKTTLTIDAGDGFVSVYDDSVDGGTSESEVTDPDAMSWRCNLKDSGVYNYCGFELIFDQHRQKGLNLQRYDTIRLWMDYDGPTETIRVYLRNYDPAYSTPNQYDSTKYNQVEFDGELTEGEGPITFSMKDFFVANWWFQRYRIAPRLTHPQFDNIVILEVQTGSSPRMGEHRFRLKKVQLTGQFIPSEQWYLGILGSWLLVALVFLVIRMGGLKRELGRKSQRERELIQVNQLLDARGRELEERAKTDPLTGAFNRKGIEDAIKEGLLAFRRRGEPLSLLFLDLDHFKAVNDTHGHQVGDQILSGLSRVIQQHVRTTDGFARWGGEEFILVCRNTGLAEGRALAEKLRRLLEGQQFDTPVAITVSFGVATLKSGEGVEQLFKRADEALYLSKKLGRNRVEVAE